MRVIQIFTALTLYAAILSIYFYNKISDGQPLLGDKGQQGERGDEGNPSKSNLDPSSLCVVQLMNDGQQIIRQNKINRNTTYDNYTQYMNNLYMRDNYKRICGSEEFSKMVEQRGTINAVRFVQFNAKKWIKQILNYRNGEQFLEDPFYSNEHWKQLLVNNRKFQEKVSPFNLIFKDKVWNWGKCN